MKNAKMVCQGIKELGFDYVGGKNAPYVWIDGKRDSWEFFDILLNKTGVVCTPGAGFGRCGNGYIRLSAFNSHENVAKAMQRIRQVLS
jgi:LL-diaminopimelate aminotransferase